MKRYVTTIIVVLFVILCVIVGARAADADDGSMFSWQDECGYICYQWADGSGDCYPCLACAVIPPTIPPITTPEPAPEPTKCEGPSPGEGCWCSCFVKEPGETCWWACPISTPELTKEACNRGIGNGAEDCDPGNSGGKPGAAGEDNE